MPIDNLEMNYNSYDSENNQTPIVQEEVTQSQRWIKDTISEINEWLDLLRLELPKTIEEQEKEVLELVKIRWLKESFEENIYNKWVYLNKIQDWVFSLVPRDTWNVNYFIDSKWKILFWLWNIRIRPFVENKKALKYAGYIERKEDW